MPFQNSNGFNNQNASQGEKKKTNFPVGRLFGTDAVMNLSVWNSDSAVYTIFSIKQSVGKDPTTGGNVYEQKMPNELPRVFMNPEILTAFTTGCESLDITQSVTIQIPQKNGSKITIATNDSQVKITLETQKQGTRTVTFEPIPFGSTKINSQWKNMLYLLNIAMKKALLAKLDTAEFGTAIAASGDAADEELPI